jgi:alpha-mannosidase
VTVNGDNVVLTAMKKAEEGDGLILRFYEWAGKNSEVQVSVPSGAASSTETNLMEKAAGGALNRNENTITFPIHPFEIQSIRVDYPSRP